MKKILPILSLFSVFYLCSCHTSVLNKTTVIQAPEEDVINLQNIKTRENITCYATKDSSAENCAAYFEAKGYVRFKNIPTQTAKYDLLDNSIYPGRKWRDNEKNPRW